eukprot:Rhum_TRINITY_DN15248_c4_g2::Rhum_TRINITY_DN15248_c4_g2_i1::g.143851::m.143851
MDTPSEECFADVLLGLPADAQGLSALRARLLPAAGADTAAPPKDVVAPLFPRLAYLVRHAAASGGDGPAGAFVAQWARRVGGDAGSVACLETMWTAAQRLAAAAAGGVDEAQAAAEARGSEATAAGGLEDLLDLALQRPSRALQLIGAYARQPVFRAFLGSEAAGEEVRTAAALVFATRLLSLSTDGARARLLAQVWEAGVSPAMTGLTASFFSELWRASWGSAPRVDDEIRRRQRFRSKAAAASGGDSSRRAAGRSAGHIAHVLPRRILAAAARMGGLRHRAVAGHTTLPRVSALRRQARRRRKKP